MFGELIAYYLQIKFNSCFLVKIENFVLNDVVLKCELKLHKYTVLYISYLRTQFQDPIMTSWGAGLLSRPPFKKIQW